jgi:hypothetical protein
MAMETKSEEGINEVTAANTRRLLICAHVQSHSSGAAMVAYVENPQGELVEWAGNDRGDRHASVSFLVPPGRRWRIDYSGAGGIQRYNREDIWI